MKLLLVIVTAIAFFAADGRDFRNEPEEQPSTGEAYLFSFVTDDQDEENMQDEPVIQASRDQPFIDVNQQVEELQHGRKANRAQCKSRNACVVMGGFCVTNATLCDGRLVPEGCKGTNCQCCVPGTLEAKMDQLEAAINNIYSNISSMLESQCKSKVTTSPIPPSTASPSTTPAVTTSPIPPSTAAPSTTPAVTTSPTPPTTAAPSTTPAVIPCPKGLFSVPGSVKQCFKFLSRGTFDASKKFCEDEGLELAKPLDPLALRIFIIKTYGANGKDSWVGARGVGTHMEWIRDGTPLPNDSPLWRDGYPGGYAKSGCVNLMAFQATLDQTPTQVYEGDGCHYNNFALCELVM